MMITKERFNRLLGGLAVVSAIMAGLWFLHHCPSYAADIQASMPDPRERKLVKHALLACVLIVIFLWYFSSLISRGKLVLKIIAYTFVGKLWVFYFAENDAVSSVVISLGLQVAQSILGCNVEDSIVHILFEPFYVCGLLFSLKLLELQEVRPACRVFCITVLTPRILGMLLGV
jgi:hypothetical protein